MSEFVCNFCGKDCKNKGGLSCHTPYCKQNSNRVQRKVSVKGEWPKGKQSPFKGKTYEEKYGLEKSQEIKQKVSKTLTGKPWVCKESVNLKRIEKIKNTAKLNGKSGGLRRGSGRGKKGWYKGYWCDSSWELAFVIFNLEHNVLFHRNTRYFLYNFKNETRKYFPDFLLENGEYIEIKGYYTQRTRSKIQQFPKDLRLKVIDKTLIGPYLKYVIDKYGKDFTSLYENKGG